MSLNVLPLHHIAQPARVSSTAAFSRGITLVEEVSFSEEARRHMGGLCVRSAEDMLIKSRRSCDDTPTGMSSLLRRKGHQLKPGKPDLYSTFGLTSILSSNATGALDEA